MLKKNEQVATLLADAHALDENKDHVFYKLPEITDWNSTTDEVALGGTTFKFTEFGLKQFLKKLKIPYQYYKACSPELRDKELREGLEDQSSKIEYLFKVKDNKIYGIIPKQYYSTLTEPFAKKITDALPTNVTISEYAMELEYTRIRFMATDTSFVDVDTLVPGVDVIFSEVGYSPFQITSTLFRKVCSNGLCLPDTQASFKMPMTRFQEAPVTAAISAMAAKFFISQQGIAELFEQLKCVELPAFDQGVTSHPELEAALSLVMPSKLLQKNYGDIVFQNYQTDGNNTLNGVINAITRTARDIEQSTEKVRLESTAGAFVSKIFSLKHDAETHNEEFELSMGNLQRLCARHA